MHLLDENASRQRSRWPEKRERLPGGPLGGHSVSAVCEGCKTLVMPFAGHIIQGMEADGRVDEAEEYRRAASVSEQVIEAEGVRQIEQGLQVMLVGPRLAFFPEPHRVRIGSKAAGDLRPRQAGLPLEPLQPHR